MQERIPLRTRFWRKVREDGECWVWTGATDKVSGYGRVTVAGSSKYSHRVAYELMVAEIPAGLQLDHLCRNRACVNPWHLEPVTPRVNTLRSESFAATNAVKTHCPQGHPYSGENLLVTNGRRHCRTCNRANVRAWYARRAAKQAA